MKKRVFPLVAAILALAIYIPVVFGQAAGSGVVNDGDGKDIDIQASDKTISANWTFTNSQNILGYRWAIGTTPGGNDVQDFTDVGLARRASNSTLSLVNGTRYYVTVGASYREKLGIPKRNLPIVEIASGAFHSIALQTDGTVWTWGNNDIGQLGDGNVKPPWRRLTPVQVLGPDGKGFLTDITAVAGGGSHTIALKNEAHSNYYGTAKNDKTVKDDGTVWTWGCNSAGQLGIGTSDNNAHPTPVQVSGLKDVIAIAGGWSYSIALKVDGTVWTWGNNDHGQLGDGTTTDRYTPVHVGLLGIIAIAGGFSNPIALKSDGTVWTWGANTFGQLGIGTSDNDAHPIPVQVNGLSGIIAIAEGSSYAMALKNDRTVWAWGNNDIGQLGDGTTTDRYTPVQVSGLSGITAIAGGLSMHAMALKGNGTIWTWGYNVYGQLGDGTTTIGTTPAQVLGLSGVIAPKTLHQSPSFDTRSVPYLDAAGSRPIGPNRLIVTLNKNIAVGDCHTMALKNDGTVWTWGSNNLGELGDGTTIDRHTPVKVIGFGDSTDGFFIVYATSDGVTVNALPHTSITLYPGKNSDSASATFKFASTKRNSSFTYVLDDGIPTSIGLQTTVTLTKLADGKHTLQVRATDAAGNADPASATYSWTINTKSPHQR